MPVTEQITIVQNAMYPIVVAILSLKFDLTTDRYNYFNFRDEERDTVWWNFPKFENLKSTFLDVGRAIQRLDLSWMEVSFLCGISLLCDGK